MRSAEDVLNLYRERRVHYEPLHSKMREIASIYNGNAVVPLPDMERSEHSSVPNLLASGVDQMAGRITSVSPSATFASLKPGVRLYDRRAQDASRTMTGWWQADSLPMKMKSRGRRLIAYGMAPVVVRWDYDNNRPTWKVRHPLEAMPSLDLEPGKTKPENCIFAYTKSAGFLKAAGYESHLRMLTRDSQKMPLDSQITLIEYLDGDMTMLLATSVQNQMNFYDPGYQSGLKAVILESFPNHSGVCPVSIPTRLTLDSMTGQFDQMIGMYYQQAKLMALETIAVEKGIFPDTYLVSRAGEVGRFLDGPHDGRTGRVNVIAGGDIKEVQSSPGYLTNPTLDRLERAQRVTAGIPAEFGGESGSNIRTGRRGDAVLSAVIDYPVAEAQEQFAFALEQEDKIAISLAKHIDGDTRRTIYVGTGNNRRPVSYVPTETFEVEDHVVSYPVTGSDMNALIIGIGQRVGLGIMSKESAAMLDPFIDNPEAEHDAIISEGLEQALMTGLQQQASQGAIPPLTLAKIMTLVKNDKMELAQALHKVTEDAAKEQQRQQEEAQAGMQGGMPGMPPPMGADGMNAGPTTQALAGGQAAIQPSEATMPSMDNLSGMLASLRRPAMTVQPMRGVARGAV